MCVSLSVPRLLFDGWSYQDYMSVLDSEDEMEELGREALEVAKVLYLLCSQHVGMIGDPYSTSGKSRVLRILSVGRKSKVCLYILVGVISTKILYMLNCSVPHCENH